MAFKMISPFKNGWPTVTKTGGGPNRKGIGPSWDISFKKKKKKNKNNNKGPKGKTRYRSIRYL